MSIKLPSGAELKITPSEFKVSRELFQALLEELKGTKMDPEKEIDSNFFKDIFCTGFSSKRIEYSLGRCMERATYNNLKITDETWEPVEAREDYLMTCFEVAKVNIAPFTKSLYAQFSTMVEKLKNGLA